MKKSAFLFVLLLSAAGSAILAPSAWGQAPPQRIEITAQRFVFKSGEVTVKVGQPVTLVLKSADVGHGLRIQALDVNIKVKADETGEVTFTPTKTGDFTGRCSVYCGSGHHSMSFVLHVVA
ncbi:MAG TPA: cupredoxin domain-containing protein [Terracidiphilus sp.]|jgi:cytochrome c oxidase subunit 2